MKVIEPSFEIIEGLSYQQMLQIVEGAYRICYASEPKGNTEEFIRSKMKLKHFSPLEHVSISVSFTYDRGVSHEKVRHRLAAFSQQSTRYCNFSKGKFGKEITVIKPSFFNQSDNTQFVTFPYPFRIPNDKNEWELVSNDFTTKYLMNKFDVWYIACLYAEYFYMQLLEMGATPQEARSVLPNSLATKIMVTANIREWIHILNLRAIGTTGKPHPQMREIMLPVLNVFKIKFPVFFEDLVLEEKT